LYPTKNSQIVANTAFKITAILTPATATIRKKPVNMPIYAVSLLNTPLSITNPITRNPNDRVPTAHTAASGDSSTEDAKVAAAMKIALSLSLVAAA
jgi:hypothetical protein